MDMNHFIPLLSIMTEKKKQTVLSKNCLLQAGIYLSLLKLSTSIIMIPNAIQITHRIRGNIIFISITVDIKRPVSVTHSFTRLLLAETSIANAHIEPTNDKKPPATIFFILFTSKFKFIYSILYNPCIFKAYRLLNVQT